MRRVPNEPRAGSVESRANIEPRDNWSLFSRRAASPAAVLVSAAVAVAGLVLVLATHGRGGWIVFIGGAVATTYRGLLMLQRRRNASTGDTVSPTDKALH
jgi:hypothetical protein